MAIAFRCGQCGRVYKVDDSLAGKRGKCKDCGAVFEIPEPGAGDDDPGPDDLFGLDESEAPTYAEEEAASAPRPKSKKRSGGLFALSSLPPWGFGVYVATIVGSLVASLVVGGEAKLWLALLGGFLCVGPFVASGFGYRFGVPFRDGIGTGLMYMFVVPYRIHYRLTHKEAFARVKLPSMGLRDLVPLGLGVAFLPVIVLTAKEMDNLAARGKKPNHVVFHAPAAPPTEPRPAPARKPLEEARKDSGRPEVKGPGARERDREAPRMKPRREAAPPVARSPVEVAAAPAFEQREVIARDVRAGMDDVVAVLAAVVDPASARDASPRLRAIAQALDDAQRRLDRIPRISAEDDARLRAIHDDALRAAAARFTDEAARIGSIPGAAPILNRDLQAFRPFVPGTDIRLVLATPKPAQTAMPAPPPAAGADSALTINVGNTDGPTNRAINSALMEMLKAEGNNWSLRSNSAGGRTWFTVSPVGDPQAFADRLPFAREAKVSGRTIDVVVDPAKVAAGAH